MKLTIGIPTFNDYSGVYMTVNALRHYQDLQDCEIIIVDNAPDSDQGNDTRLFIGHCTDENIRYIPYAECVGPANAKDEVFKHARGNAVLVIDSHVVLVPAAIEWLKDFYEEFPETMDLYQGPRYMDNLRRMNAATHFNPVWSSGMLGQWSVAWKTPDGHLTATADNEGMLRLSRFDGETIDRDIPFSGHEAWLIDQGYTLAIDSIDKFEIPSQGMGLFSCRREAWLGFNPLFREFGGEEGYIHDKYRNAGRSTWCLNFLGWQHRDRKSDAVEYPARTESMFRNYVLGHRENGKDNAELVAHYSTRLPQEKIDRILANPESYISDVKTIASEPITVDAKHRNRNELFNWCLLQKGHLLNEHGSFLSKSASKFKHVTEISNNCESSIYLLAGNPDVLRSYQEDADYKIKTQQELLNKEVNNRKQISWVLTLGNIDEMPAIDDTEALFLNSRHTYDRMKAELEAYSHRVSKVIMIANSIRYGQKGEDDGPGIGKAVYEFIKDNPRWFIVRHDPQQNGMTTLSCVQSMKPVDAIWPWDKGCGPGTELKKMFESIGIVSHPTCSCNARARAMDQYGIEWCEENIDKIVAGLKEEHAKQSKAKNAKSFVGRVVNMLPFSEVVARKAVSAAIERARVIRDSGDCPE